MFLKFIRGCYCVFIALFFKIKDLFFSKDSWFKIRDYLIYLIYIGDKLHETRVKGGGFYKFITSLKPDIPQKNDETESIQELKERIARLEKNKLEIEDNNQDIQKDEEKEGLNNDNAKIEEEKSKNINSDKGNFKNKF